MSNFSWNQLPAFHPSKATERKWVWKDFIPELGITLVIGASGSFKSTFLLALSNAVCSGEDFLGRTTRQRRVLYLDNENAPDVLANRHREMKLQLEKNKRFRLLSVYDAKPMPRIDSEEFKSLVMQSYGETGRPLLIILDHWSTFLQPGHSGLETGETTPIFQALKHLCGLGATIVILMHTLKSDPKTFYGCKDITDKADAYHLFVKHKLQINVTSDLKRYGPKRQFCIQPIVKHWKSGNSYIAGFRIAEDWQVEVMKELIRNNRKANQRQLGELGVKPLKMGRDKVIAFIKEHTGKHWKAIPGLRKKQTYVVVEEK